MEAAHVAIPPIVRVHQASLLLEIWKIKPIIAVAEDFAGIVIVVIFVGVGREMNGAEFSSPGGDLVIEKELLEEIGSSI